MVCIYKISANTNIIFKYIIIIYMKNLLIFESSFKVLYLWEFPQYFFFLDRLKSSLSNTVYNNSIMGRFPIY